MNSSPRSASSSSSAPDTGLVRDDTGQNGLVLKNNNSITVKYGRTCKIWQLPVFSARWDTKRSRLHPAWGQVLKHDRVLSCSCNTSTRSIVRDFFDDPIRTYGCIRKQSISQCPVANCIPWNMLICQNVWVVPTSKANLAHTNIVIHIDPISSTLP